VPAITANGLTFEYDERGNPGDPVVLLVMGLGAQMVLWPEALCDMIAARGFRVVRFDNRDVGLTTKLDHLGVPRIAIEALRFTLRLPVRAAYRIDDMAKDTIAVMDALGIERAHLCGVSMGGMICQGTAALAPGRVASLVSIMSTTGARRLPSPTSRARRALLMKPAKPGDIEGATVRLMQLLRVIGSRTHPAEEGYLRALCERHTRRSYHPPGMARQLVAIAASGDRTKAVRTIKAPTLVLHGDEDPLLPPPHGEATARAIQEGGGRATYSIVAGMGHDLPVELFPLLVDRIATHCRG
jgi:proline iminopeptidase